MLRKLGIPTLAVAAALAMTAPAATFARDRDDHRGRSVERHEEFRGHEFRAYDHDRGHFNFGVGIYAAPAPAASGFYDRFGVWHPNGFYDRFGVWHPYGY